MLSHGFHTLYINYTVLDTPESTDFFTKMKLSIMSTIIAIICGALAAPTTEGQDTPNSGLGSRGVASGCYPLYEDTRGP